MSLDRLARNVCKDCDGDVTFIRINSVGGELLDEWWSHDSIPVVPHEARVV